MLSSPSSASCGLIDHRAFLLGYIVREQMMSTPHACLSKRLFRWHFVYVSEVHTFWVYSLRCNYSHRCVIRYHRRPTFHMLLNFHKSIFCFWSSWSSTWSFKVKKFYTKNPAHKENYSHVIMWSSPENYKCQSVCISKFITCSNVESSRKEYARRKYENSHVIQWPRRKISKHQKFNWSEVILTLSRRAAAVRCKCKSVFILEFNVCSKLDSICKARALTQFCKIQTKYITMHPHIYTHACTLEHAKTLSVTHTYIQPSISKCKAIKIVPKILILHGMCLQLRDVY